jgi:hypothetical protein
MARCLVKLADNEYVEWSTVVDAPVTAVGTRDEIVKHARDEFGRQGASNIEERLQRCEERGHSAMWPGAGDSVEDLIRGNRAGEGEAEVTLDEIRHLYREPDGAMLACATP